MNTGEIELHQTKSEPWNVTLLDTGLDTMTGGRLKRALEWTKDKSVCFTYADGLSNINIHELVKFHKEKATCIYNSRTTSREIWLNNMG